MSHRESDREDLLREATALVERAELNVAGFAETIVVGFRRGGAASFFFGADPVYQFNSNGELRRAYVDGQLYKADRGRLVSLRRERSATETALLRTELTPDDEAAFIQAMQQRLQALHQALSAGSFSVTGQIPPSGNVPAQIVQWLQSRPAEIVIARAPNVAGR